MGPTAFVPSYCLIRPFSPGVHWLQEPRSGIYNFTPWLQNIPDVNDFAFERLPQFVKSSRDEVRDRDLFCGLRTTNEQFSGIVEACETRRENVWGFDLILEWNVVASILPHIRFTNAGLFASQSTFLPYGSCITRLSCWICSPHNTPRLEILHLVNECRPRFF